VVGLRLFGSPGPDETYPWFDSVVAHRTWESAAEHGLAMDLMYVPGLPTDNVIGRIIALARRFPDMPVLLDHCGWPHLNRGDAGTIGPELHATQGVPNILFKVTGINFNRFAGPGIDPARFVRNMVDQFGIERLMWGSDVGNTRDSYEEMIAQAINATSLLSGAERRAVLHDNGRRILGPRRAA
jgi:L-fuconolactonase